MPNNGKVNARSTAPNLTTTSNSSVSVTEVFGRRMKEERKKQGLKQEDLADLANVSMDTIKRYESGSKGMRLDVAYDIACALNVPLQSMLPQSRNDVERTLRDLESALPYILEMVKNQ